MSSELELFDKYGRQGVEPFENWMTDDLAQLEIIVNGILQERCRQAEVDAEDFWWEPPYDPEYYSQDDLE